MQVFLVIVGIVAVLALVGLAIHVVLTWADRRGWVYYRNPGRRMPPSLGLLEEIYQPSISHVVDQQVTEDTEADQDPSGAGGAGEP